MTTYLRTDLSTWYPFRENTSGIRSEVITSIPTCILRSVWASVYAFYMYMYRILASEILYAYMYLWDEWTRSPILWLHVTHISNRDHLWLYVYNWNVCVFDICIWVYTYTRYSGKVPRFCSGELINSSSVLLICITFVKQDFNDRLNLLPNDLLIFKRQFSNVV